MNAASLPDLERSIEALVRQHLAEMRKQVQSAVDRALSGSAGKGAPRAGERRAPRAMGSRRSGDELSRLGSALYEEVRSHPGEAMPKFAQALGVTVRELHRPMDMLRRAGRIRSVGRKQSTRYFPTLAGE